MNAQYDPEVDIITIIIHEDKLDHGEDIGDGVIVHYNKDNRPVEIEILNAKNRLVDWITIALNADKQSVPAA